MVAILIKEKEREDRQILDELNEVEQEKVQKIIYLRRRVVSLWASATFVGIGPSPQANRRWSVTREWKVLLERACWTWFM